jgi:anti-sigma B factor antagonist
LKVTTGAPPQRNNKLKETEIMTANPNIAKPNLTPDYQFSFVIAAKRLSIHTEVRGNVLIFHCQGRLVFGDEGVVLRERVGNMLEASPNVVMNLREVDHIDSGGIGVLIGLLVSARNRGGDLKLVAPNQHVTDVLRRTKLHTIFRLYESDDDAITGFHMHQA